MLACVATTGIAVIALPADVSRLLRAVNSHGHEARIAWIDRVDPPGAENEEDRRTATHRPRASPWAVLIKGADGKPVSGLDILARRRTCMPSACNLGRTGADGRAELDVERPFLFGRERDRLRIYLGTETSFGSPRGPDYEVTREGAVIIADDLVPVEVIVVDASTGRPVDAVVTGPSHVHRGRDATYAMGVPDSVLHDNEPRQTLCYCADLPSGYALEDRADPEWIGGAVSRFADRVRIMVRARREVTLHVQVVDPRGSPVEGAELGIKGVPVACTGRSGRTTIPIPHLDGERVRVVACDGTRAGVAELVLDDVPGDRDLVVRLTDVVDGESLEPKGLSDAPFSGPSRGACIGLGPGDAREEAAKSKDHPEVHEDGTWEEEIGTASLAVTVLRRNGRPAAGLWGTVEGAACRVRELDGDGHAFFGDLAGGNYSVSVCAPGFVQTESEVTLVGGAHTQIDLLEQEGWTARVRVIDEREAPVRFAVIDVVDQPYALLEDGTQVLGLYTDVDGWVTLTQLCPGSARVEVRFGSRRASAKIDPADPTMVLSLPR
jgi:hypothetical protein